MLLVGFFWCVEMECISEIGSLIGDSINRISDRARAEYNPHLLLQNTTITYVTYWLW